MYFEIHVISFLKLIGSRGTGLYLKSHGQSTCFLGYLSNGRFLLCSFTGVYFCIGNVGSCHAKVFPMCVSSTLPYTSPEKNVSKNHHSVDGTNPAPPGNINLVNDGINCISTGAGFLPSTVHLVLGFFRFLCLFGMLKWPFQTFPQTNINPKYRPFQKETI